MWKLPLLEARTSITGNGDTDVIAIFQDTSKKAIPPKGAYAPFIEKFRKTEVFNAKQGSMAFIRFAQKGKAENVLFLGLGASEELTLEKLRALGGSLWTKLKSEKSKEAVIWIDTFSGLKGSKSDPDPSRSIRALAEGLILSAYQFNKYKSNSASLDKDFGPSRIIFLTQEKSLKDHIDTELKQVQAMGESVNITRNWSNEPSNHGTPVYFANEAKRLARHYGLKCKILTEQEAAREKMGLFLGVGQGSVRENRMVIVEYAPKNVKGTKTIALVGKGVTFDSGGISIKPATRMEDMKHDMTGAATIMGAVILASQWKISNRVIGIMAFTENMPDGEAIQPGNILTSRSGKTVEIINTDAEGRLILADALDYAQDYQPDVVIDVATLTGAVSIALGKQCCGLFSNDDALMDAIRRAGDIHSERIWPLPLYDEYFDDLKSDSADMKNSANDGNGGAIRAALFLKQFIRKNTRWAHLDIAAMAYHMGHIPYYPKRGASGAYVRTLAQFAADY